MSASSSWVRAVVLVCALGAGAEARAGYYMEHEAVLPNPQTMQPQRSTVRSWHEGRRFKRQTPMTNEFVIIDLDKGEVVGINEDLRTYWRMPSARYHQVSLMSLMVMGVTPTADGGIATPPGLFKKTGQTAEIAGRKAYEVEVQGKLPPGMRTTFWLSTEVPLPMARMVEQLNFALGEPKHPGFQDLFAQWRSLEGYPVQSITSMRFPQGGVITTSETLVLYRDEKVSPSVFEVPKGYSMTTDPITLAEQALQQAKQGQPPAGLSAPLVTPPAQGR
ncbi:MAG: hypothetical protein ACO3JL_13130 [Myxococcota bacterium]